MHGTTIEEREMKERRKEGKTKEEGRKEGRKVIIFILNRHSILLATTMNTTWRMKTIQYISDIQNTKE